MMNQVSSCLCTRAPSMRSSQAVRLEPSRLSLCAAGHFCHALFLLDAKMGKHRGQPVRPVWACAIQVELRFVLWILFVTQFGRGMSSPAYKYKCHGRLRSYYPIESINLQFSYFSPNPNFSNLVLFFARLDGVQGCHGWPATSRQP